MLVSDIIRKVRQKIEDENYSVWDDDESIIDVINEEKNDVFCQLITSGNPPEQTSVNVTFLTGVSEVLITGCSLGILKVDNYPFDPSIHISLPVEDFRNIDSFTDNSKLYYRILPDRAIYLGRKFTDKEETFTVYFIKSIVDVISTSSILFIPEPAINLLITKCVNTLNASRNRINQFFVQKEVKQEQILEDVQQKLNQTRPRHVIYTG